MNMLAVINGSVLLWAFLWVIAGALIFYLGNWLIGYMALGDPASKIMRVILGVLFFLFLVNGILTLAGRPFIAI